MTGWSSGYCETNEINIHYTRTGGCRPPVLLLHGLAANGACWTAVAQALEGDYDVIMPDARGHGKSSAPEVGYRYEDHAQDVVGLIAALRLSLPVLIGHSMGGMTAAVVASGSPKLLRGVILADPTFLSPEAQEAVQASDVTDQHRRYLRLSWEAVAAEGRARHPERSVETIEQIARARLQTSLSAFEVLKPPNPDYRQVVRAIEVPGLLVVGGPAGVVSREAAADLQQLNARVQVEQIKEVGHWMFYDQPERFAAVVKLFLSSTLSS